MIHTLHRPARLIAALASALLLTTPAMSAGAAGTTLGHSVAPSTVADGGTVDLTVTAPLYGAGTATRWLQEKIDPSAVRLTSPSQIKAPEGWKVQYSTDGVSFTDIPPSTPAAWGRVRFVRARGTLTSGGVVDGKQAVTTTASQGVVSSPSVYPAGASGDGWNAAFSNSGQIFNLNHHLLRARIECREVATAAACPGSWPWVAPSNISTPNIAPLISDPVHHHLWFPSASTWGGGVVFGGARGLGVVCLDISDLASPQPCGGSWDSASFLLERGYSLRSELHAVVNFSQVGSRVYLYSRATNAIDCFDMAANDGRGGACPNQPWEVSNTGWWGTNSHDSDLASWPWSTMTVLGSRVIIVNGAGAFCVDAATNAPCAGWSSPTRLEWVGSATIPTQPVIHYPQFNDQGKQSAACFITWDRSDVNQQATQCLSATGRLVEADPAYSSYFGTLLSSDSAALAVVGHKIYLPSHRGPNLGCFDTKLKAACVGWNPPREVLVNDFYTLTPDPNNPSCLFEVTDRSGIKAIDANTGAAGCAVPPVDVEFTSLTPSLGCASSATSWSHLTLAAPALGASTGASSATLGIADSSGRPVPGWQAVPIPASGTVNLTQLPVALTGPHPTFSVTLNGASSAVTEIRVSLTSLGNSPQLCISPTVSYTCPGGYDAVTALPTSFADLLASDDTAPRPGSALRVSVKAPGLLSCRGAVSGTVLDTSGNPVPGVPVRITGPDGTPVQLNGSDYTTTTKASGTYHFIGLRAGVSYTVTFPDTSVATAVSSTVPDGDGAGTTTASGGSVTSNDAPVLVGATTVINALYTQLIDLVPDAEVVPKNTTTTLHPLNNDEPATGNTLDATSLKLCGPSEAPPACAQTTVTVPEGSFVVNPDGSVSFTPVTDFTGTVTPVTYQATDSGPTTGSAVISVTVVGTPTAQPATSIDDVNVVQSLDPMSSATTDPAAGWAEAPMMICGALESAGSCAQSTVSVDGVGTYEVNPDRTVTFTPVHNYVGSPAPISFDVVDGIGQRASSTISVTVRPTIPEVPTSASVTAGTTSATVSFDVPAWDGGSPVTSYLVEDGAGKHSCTVSVSGPGPYSCTVTGLVPGKVYGFVITATNAVGTGPEAAVSTRVGVLACTPGTYVEQRLGLLQSTTDFTTWTTLGQENGFVNAIAYRPDDGFLYGIGTAARDLTGPENHLMRIAGDGSVTDLGVVEGLPATRSEAKFPAGAFDPYSGHLVVGGRGHLYSIDVDTHRATQIPLPDGVSRVGWDLVIEGEWLWTVTSTQVVGINLSTDEHVSYDLPAGYESHGYGSVWSGSDDSSLYFQSNATGDITRVTGLGSSPSFSTVGTLPSAPRNDGTSCPGAPA